MGKRGGVVDDSIYAVIVFVVAFTTLLAPLALRYVMRDKVLITSGEASNEQ